VSTAVAIFAITMLVGLSLGLVGGEWWRERSAMLRRQIDDALNNPLPPGFLRRR
jgi:hypothetical protein